MAKQSSNYGVAPWQLKKGAINDFTLVTEKNRSNAIVLGRILYFMEPIGVNHIFRGAISVNSRLTKGKWMWPRMPWMPATKEATNKTHFEVYVDKDEDYESWKTYYDYVITKGINEKTLYICQKDPILTFLKKE